MARKKAVEPIREFLEQSKDNILAKMYKVMNEKKFLEAEAYNRFVDDILAPAIKLCGEEKLKEGEIE